MKADVREDIHEELCRALDSDLLAAVFIRLVELDVVDDYNVIDTAERLVADPLAYDAALERGYRWVADFEELLRDHGLIEDAG